jgi:hypothetical protein
MPNGEGHDLIEDLDDEDDQTREVYARYGLAMYVGQVLEHNLANLLVIAERWEGKIPTEAEWEDRYEVLFRRTAGALVNLASDHGRVVDADLASCAAAVSERNRLAHRFFRENAENFLTPPGRQRMLDDVDKARAVLHQADRACDRLVQELLSRVGITPERVRAEADSLLARHLEDTT